ncbi:MAG: hypothetical protein HDR37_04025 [Treponema sp.]|nr:hypothetical protein [Treponema sp.]
MVVDKPYVPELVFPIFPALSGAERNGDGTVTVSEDWIVRLAEYRIRIEETEKTYGNLRSLFADGEQ